MVNVKEKEESFKNDIREGKGKEYYENGNIKYYGDFKNGKYEGYGLLYNSDGSIKYAGNFEKGEPDKCIIF